MGRKRCRKRRNWLPAFSLFPTMLSKSLQIRFVKSWDCVFKVKSNTIFIHKHEIVKLARTLDVASTPSTNQIVENAGVAFVTRASERNEFFEKINEQ